MLKLRGLLLVIVSFAGIVAVVVMIWLRLGRNRSSETGKRLVDDPVYLAKRNLISPLARLRGSRPFTPQELDLLRKFANDPNEFIRFRVLTALYHVRDPKQRQEAIKIALEKCKDPDWLVRAYAPRVLANQNAKEFVHKILPLLNDPQPEVREEAKKALQKLGYQVRE